MQQLHQYIEEGSIFHINACRPEHLIYDTGKEALPSLAAVDLREIKEQAVTHFNLSYERSISFFHGAESFIAQEKKELAAFMLHQTAELALRGTITALSKIDIRTHSIKILLQHCYRLIPELALLFPAAETQEDPMIALLENAYLNARYEDEFQVKAEALNPLLEKVSRLLIAIHQLTHDTIAAFSREWLKDDKIIA